jgi:hypothetical protein
MGSQGRRQAVIGRQDEGGDGVKKKILAVAGVGAACVFAVLFLTMTATAAKDAGKGSSQGECYTDAFGFGDTHAKVSDGYIQSAHFEWPGKSGQVESKGWIKANMAFDVFGGSSMQGHLVVDFYVGGNGNGPGHFESKCILEAGTNADFSDDECDDPNCVFLATDTFEAEFEGTVTGLPGSKKAQSAVAQLSGGRTESGKVVLKLQIETGTACNDNDYLDGGNQEGSVGKSSGSINADDVDAFRVNFPDFCI